MRRWNSDLADTVGPVSLDSLHRTDGYGPAVQRYALFGGQVVLVGGTAGGKALASGPAAARVRVAAKAGAVARAGAGAPDAFVEVGAAARARAVASAGFAARAELGGFARAIALATGSVAVSVPGGALLGATEDETIAEDPPAAGAASLLLRSRPVVFDRTPLGRAVSRPEGTTMLTRKQFDTAGELVVELARVVDGVATAAPELAEATLVQMRRRAPSGAVTRVEATVDDVDRGLVRASLIEAMAEAGAHALTFEITTAVGLITYPYSGALTLVVEPP